MTTELIEPPAATEPRIIRRVRAYCCEYGGAFPAGEFGTDLTRQYVFQPNCFASALANAKNITLTTDLNGVAHAQTGDGTLRLSSDTKGLLVEAELRDTPENRMLLRHIDCGRVKGWSFKSQPHPFFMRSRREGGVEFIDIFRSGISEVCFVVSKRPRAASRMTPLFLTPADKE